MSLPSLSQPFVTGFVPTLVGKAPRVHPDLSLADRLGNCKARCAIGRTSHTVEPGLYALGNPGKYSPVFVTANYKMSFDHLRHSLPGRSGWIVVLDTKGINVWCAAGKGTFGTDELVERIDRIGLKEVVSHRDLILPQLAAPGTASHLVQKRSGFRVNYGPVRARDLPSFLDAGMKGSPELRTKTFSFWERAVLVPVELVQALRAVFILLAALFILSGSLGQGGFWSDAVEQARTFVPALLGAVTAGAVLTPLLLPWLPGRAFSVKGMWPGLAGALLLWLIRWGETGVRVEAVPWMVLMISISSYLAMNFTGASTFTSLSGVKREMRRALPFQVLAAVAAVGVWIHSLIAQV